MYLSTEIFIERATQIHGNKYDYSLVKYTRIIDDVIIICHKHGKFLQVATNHLAGHGCTACVTSDPQVMLNDFIEKSNQIHNNKYDYSLTEYTGYKSGMIIICPEHGEFSQTRPQHLSGSGCPKCARIESRLSIEEFLERAYQLHGNKYDYSSTVLIKSDMKIIINCPEHGDFEQLPYVHLRGGGCSKCVYDARRKTEEQFIKEAISVHGEVYDYSKMNYTNSDNKITIICPKHGEFSTGSGAHLKGRGCLRCSSSLSNVSKPEIKWLDSLNIPEEYRQKVLYIDNKRIKTDAYDPTIKTIYEFWGDFWHGNLNMYNADDINPKNKFTYGELFQITQNKRQLILENGYNLVEIWGSEWKTKQKKK